VLQSSQMGMTVNLQPHTGKLKLKGVGLSGATRTEFNVNLYRNPSSDVVVECTKEVGCTVLFNRLYQQLLTCLGDMVMRRLNDNGPRKLSNSFPLSLPPLPSLSPPSSLPVLFSLLDRASSPFLDQQLQACESLLETSRGDCGIQLIELALNSASRVDVMGVLSSLFRSESEDVVRITALLLENLLKLGSAAFTERVSRQMVARMFEILDGPMTYLNRDTKRHVSAGLHAIAKTRRDTFSPAQRQALEKCQMDWDPVIKANVQATLHVA